MSNELTRDELNDRARELGIENPEELDNKAAVEAAIADAELNTLKQGDEGEPREGVEVPADGEEHEVEVGAQADEPEEGEQVADGDRRPLERRASTGEWKCPFCPGPGGSMESRVRSCPSCGATIDGDEVVAVAEAD